MGDKQWEIRDKYKDKKWYDGLKYSNDLSANTEITTGTTFPGLSCVLELNCLQNSIILTPAAPSAGPTGGEGLAAPPLICNFNTFCTSFAILII